jgi:hypothetical protein
MATMTQPFEELRGYQFINLTTSRRNGEPVSTPVTFVELDDKIYVITGRTSGKVNRINNNPKVEISPCSSSGKSLDSAIPAQARMLSTLEQAVMRPRIKFPVPAPLMFLFNLRRSLRQGGNVYLEIS